MSNLFRDIASLIPRQPERVIRLEVIQPRADGTTIGRTPEGNVRRVKGGGIPAGSFAFVEGNRITGPAPNLPLIQFDV